MSCPDTFFSGGVPAIEFTTRVWHPFVAFDTGKPCTEYWDAYYTQRIPRDASSTPKPSLINFAETLRSFFANVHTDLGDAVAVNVEAMAQIRAGGVDFDARAAAETARYARAE